MLVGFSIKTSAAGVSPVQIPRLEIRGPGDDLPPGPVRQRWFDGDGRLIATGGRDLGRWWMHWAGLATFWFGETGAVVADPVSTERSRQLDDIFVRGVVPVVLLGRGCEALHASAIEHAGGVIGFCGNSGTGKSTVALALAASGLVQFADDTVVYQPLEDRMLAVGLPFPARTDETARAAIDAIRSFQPVQRIRSATAPLRRIYHLVRDGALDPHAPRFTAIPPAQCVERLLAHAHPFEMGTDERRRSFFEHLLALAGNVEVCECRFAPSLDALASLTTGIREHAGI